MSPEHPRETLKRRLGGALAEFSGVRLAYLFGSRATGRAAANSDFDIAVLLGEPLASEERGTVIRRLAGRLGLEVSSRHLDIVILNEAPALLRQRVLRDGALLYQRTPEDRVRFSIATIRDYQDTYVRRQELVRRRIENLKAGKTHGGRDDLLEKARSAARLLAEAEEVPGS